MLRIVEYECRITPSAYPTYKTDARLRLVIEGFLDVCGNLP
jgi:hypothetical protein